MNDSALSDTSSLCFSMIFINLTQVHYFTVNAHDSFTLVRLPLGTLGFTGIQHNETFRSVLLASHVVMVQSLQPKGRGFESTHDLFYLYLIRLSSFIIDVLRPLSNGFWIILFQMVDV